MSFFICLTLFLSLSSTQNSLSCSSFSSQQVCESSVDVDCESSCVWNVGQTTSTTSSTSSTASSTVPQNTPHSSRVVSPPCASLSAPWDCVRGHCAQTGSACTFHHDRCVCSTQRGYDDVAESDTDICAAIKERWLVRFRFFLVFVKNFEHKSCVVHGCQLWSVLGRREGFVGWGKMSMDRPLWVSVAITPAKCELPQHRQRRRLLECERGWWRLYLVETHWWLSKCGNIGFCRLWRRAERNRLFVTQLRRLAQSSFGHSQLWIHEKTIHRLWFEIWNVWMAK